MVGGTVADLFRAKQRGLAMNVFAVLNFIGGVSQIFQGSAGLCADQLGSWQCSYRVGGYGRWREMGLWRE